MKVILVVDEQELNRKAVVLLVEHKFPSYEVVEAEDLPAAGGILDTEGDLVLVVVGLGINWQAYIPLLQAIREREIPLAVLCSVKAGRDAVIKQGLVEPDDALMKPFSDQPEGFLTVVGRLLEL